MSMYKKYELNVTPELYSNFEDLRKMYAHEPLKKTKMVNLLCEIGIPANTDMCWKLCMKYNLFSMQGRNATAMYLFTKEQPAYSRFQEMEKEYDKERPKVIKKEPVRSYEKGRTPLDDAFCIEFLKKQGHYIILDVNTDVNKLKDIINPVLLLQISNVKIK